MAVAPRVSLVTLGVRDVAVSEAFYRALGWEVVIAADGGKERFAGVVKRRAMREQKPHGQGADRRGGTEPAVAVGVHVQNIPGIDGQESHGAAQENGE